ncbi:acyl carrier protein [Kiritimatiellota bacterium B12222]|nr:acyl carrier protein [Kiritimatiellota bacterium B12222]
MENLNLWLFATIIVILIVSLLFNVGRKREWFTLLTEYGLIKELESYFSGRPKLSDEDFYITYFQDQGIPKEIPIRVRGIFEEQFEADFSRITNTDDFSEEMKFIWGYDSLVDVEIVMALEDEFDIKIENSEAEKMKSIQDIVMCVWNKKNDNPTMRPTEPPTSVQLP